MFMASEFAQLFVTSYVYDYKFYIWLVTKSFTEFIAYGWDIWIDFGLLRSKQPGRYGLRDDILFPGWFYYFAMVEDLILRFFFLIPIFKWS